MEGNIYKGIVRRGMGVATKLGFPTVNISLEESDASGIYAGEVTIGEFAKPLPAAVYADQERKILEAHIFDFDGDLVGKKITIELRKKIRDSKQFENEAESHAAIADDVRIIRQYFSPENERKT